MTSKAQIIRTPYKGESRKLIIAIDIGTTFTAASFCIAEPGEIPQFVEVR
jgi:molecular chaperone DnaK (HSP70)